MSSKKASTQKFKMPPRPDQELLTWARANRPDMVLYLEELFDGIPAMGQRGEAMMLLIATSFAAGRWYNEAHGDEGNLFGKNPYKK